MGKARLHGVILDMDWLIKQYVALLKICVAWEDDLHYFKISVVCG